MGGDPGAASWNDFMNQHGPAEELTLAKLTELSKQVSVGASKEVRCKTCGIPAKVVVPGEGVFCLDHWPDRNGAEPVSFETYLKEQSARGNYVGSPYESSCDCKLEEISRDSGPEFMEIIYCEMHREGAKLWAKKNPRDGRGSVGGELPR